MSAPSTFFRDPNASGEGDRPRLVSRAWVEIGAMTGLLLSYLWLWRRSFPGDFYVCLALYAGIGFVSHLRAGETAAEIGVRVDNLGRAFRVAALPVLAVAMVPFLVGLFLGTLHQPPKPVTMYVLFRAWASGTLQQYGLACFFYQRLRETLGDERKAVVAASALFALFHLPNPFLTPVTFLTGLVACWIYRREPNVFVLGAMHAAISRVIVLCLDPAVTFRMRVGPGFLRAWQQMAGLEN